MRPFGIITRQVYFGIARVIFRPFFVYLDYIYLSYTDRWYNPLCFVVLFSLHLCGPSVANPGRQFVEEGFRLW